jgi:hypothetical protein
MRRGQRLEHAGGGRPADAGPGDDAGHRDDRGLGSRRQGYGADPAPGGAGVRGVCDPGVRRARATFETIPETLGSSETRLRSSAADAPARAQEHAGVSPHRHTGGPDGEAAAGPARRSLSSSTGPVGRTSRTRRLLATARAGPQGPRPGAPRLPSAGRHEHVGRCPGPDLRLRRSEPPALRTASARDLRHDVAQGGRHEDAGGGVPCREAPRLPPAPGAQDTSAAAASRSAGRRAAAPPARPDTGRSSSAEQPARAQLALEHVHVAGVGPGRSTRARAGRPTR